MAKQFGCGLSLAIFAAAVLAFVYVLFPTVPAEKRALLKGLGDNPRIEHLKILGRGNDFPFPIGEPFRPQYADFRIKERSETRITLAAPHPEICTGTDHLYVDSLGPYSLSPAVDIGPGGDGPLPPFRVASVDDLIDHYDDLLIWLGGQPPTQTYVSRTDGHEETRMINRARGGTGRHGKRLKLTPPPR